MDPDFGKLYVSEKKIPFFVKNMLHVEFGESEDSMKMCLQVYPSYCTGNNATRGLHFLNYIAANKLSFSRILNLEKDCNTKLLSQKLRAFGGKILSIEKSKGGWIAYNTFLRNEKIKRIDAQLTVREQAFMSSTIDDRIVSLISKYKSICYKLSSIVPFLVAFSLVYGMKIHNTFERFIGEPPSHENGLRILQYISCFKVTIRDLFSILDTSETDGEASRDMIKMVKENAEHYYFYYLSASLERERIPECCIRTLKGWNNPTLPTTLQLYEMDGMGKILGEYYDFLVFLQDPLFLEIGQADSSIIDMNAAERAFHILSAITKMRNYDLDKIISALSLIPRGDSKEEVEEKPAKKTKVDNDDRRECMVCLDAVRSTVFVPCGHTCCCNGCSEKLKQCPFCRANIVQTVKIFSP
jgi:hypothetical protein